MLTKDMIDLIHHVRLGFVATTHADGSPNLSPKGTLAVFDDLHLFFINIASPDTVQNIQSNPQTEINVIDFIKRKGYGFKAVASFHQGDEIESRALQILKDMDRDPSRYHPRGVVLLKITAVQEILSPAYYAGDTEKMMTDFYKTYYFN